MIAKYSSGLLDFSRQGSGPGSIAEGQLVQQPFKFINVVARQLEDYFQIKDRFLRYCRVFIYSCGSISLQLRDIMLISLISKTINFGLKYKVSFSPLLKWEPSLIIRHPAKRTPLIPPSIILPRSAAITKSAHHCIIGRRCSR